MKDHFYYYGNGNISLYRLNPEQFSSTESMLLHLNSVKERGFNTVSYLFFNNGEMPVKQLKQFAAKAKALGLVPMVDIELNWIEGTAKIRRQFPHWFGRPQKVLKGYLPFLYQDEQVRAEVIEQFWKPFFQTLIEKCGFLGIRFEHLFGVSPALRAQLYSLARKLNQEHHSLPFIICEDISGADTLLKEHADELKMPDIAGPNFMLTESDDPEMAQLKSEILFRKPDGTPRLQRGGGMHFVSASFETVPEEPKASAHKRFCAKLAKQRFTAAGGWEFYDHELSCVEDAALIKFVSEINQLASQLMSINSDRFSVQTLQLAQHPDLLVYVRRHEPLPAHDLRQVARTEVVVVNANPDLPFIFGEEVLHDIACAYQQKMAAQGHLTWDEAYRAINQARVLVAANITLSAEMEQQVNKTVFTHTPPVQFFKSWEHHEQERDKQLAALYGEPLTTLLNSEWLVVAKKSQTEYERLRQEELRAEKTTVDAQTSPIAETQGYSALLSAAELIEKIGLRKTTAEQAAQAAQEPASSPRPV